MNLNLTSLEEAWGVSDREVNSVNHYMNPTHQSTHLRKYVTPIQAGSSQISHPNAITQSLPTRMDVAIYDKNIIKKLHTQTSDNITLFVTNLIRRYFTKPEKQTEQPDRDDRIEFYEKPRCLSWFESSTDNYGDLMIILLFVLLLIDKMLTIFKNS